MDNASRAFLDAVRNSMRHIRRAIGAPTMTPKLLTAAERLQYEGYRRREETNKVVLAMSDEAIGIKELVRRTGDSRNMVRRVLRGQRSDVFHMLQSSLEIYLPSLDAQRAAGAHNGTELW